MTVSFDQITFYNIDQVEVASVSNERSYGRRFQLKNTDEDLRFKQLFRKAQKLKRKAKSLEELAKVKRFIAKLVTVETDAIAEYENRDCMYKFRTWFHRFFGGAFFGSHLKRLNSLNKEVESKTNKVLNERKTEILDNLPLFERFLVHGTKIEFEDQTYDVSWNSPLLRIGDSEIQITEEHSLVIPDTLMPVFDQVLKVVKNKDAESNLLIEQVKLLHSLGNQTFEFEGETFQVTVSQNPVTLTIGALELSLLEGGSCCIKNEGVEGDFPPAFKPVFHELLSRAYKQSSSYTYGNISISRPGLLHIPEWHLAQLCLMLYHSLQFSVSYLGEIGSDAGGVSRDYISTLAFALQNNTSLFSEVDGSLKIPRIHRESDELIPKCSEEESQTYKNLGKLFAHCYLTESSSGGGVEAQLLSTGCYFSDALFRALLALDRDEIETPFDALDRNTHVKLAEVILRHLDSGNTAVIKNIIDSLSLFSLSPETLEEYFKNPDQHPILMTAASFPGMDAHFDNDCNLAIDQATFIDDLYQALFSNTTMVKELKGISLASMMAPLHAIAVGFQSNNSIGDWDEFRAQDPKAISHKVQGSLDRKDIISHLQNTSWDDSTIAKKARWLKEWIRDEENGATEDELKLFLKFVTGGASLPDGKDILIEGSDYGGPYPTACTCGLGISISSKLEYPKWAKAQWDSDKKSFIRNLKVAIQTVGTQMG